MKKIAFFLFVLLLHSCSPTEKPKDLLSKDEMAGIMADLAIYDQGFLVDSLFKPEEASVFVLKKHQATPHRFKESYTYYIQHPKEYTEIYNKAKENILGKDPKVKELVEKKLKENNGQQPDEK